MTELTAGVFPPNGGALPSQTPQTLPIYLRKPRLRRWEASSYLEAVHGIQMAPTTLAKLASIGGGPKFQRINRTPLYATSALDEWAAQKLSRPMASTSDEGD